MSWEKPEANPRPPLLALRNFLTALKGAFVNDVPQVGGMSGIALVFYHVHNQVT